MLLINQRKGETDKAMGTTQRLDFLFLLLAEKKWTKKTKHHHLE
jgi:hypothetical protein